MVGDRLAIEKKMIRDLKAGVDKGEEALAEYYSAPLYGVIKGMHACPLRSMEILKRVLTEIGAQIVSFDKSKLRFFSWAMQQARRLSVEALHLQQGQEVDQSCTAILLVINRGFSLEQAAAMLGQSKAQVARDLRLQLKLQTIGKSQPVVKQSCPKY